jgi:nitrate reductase delta subunit
MHGHAHRHGHGAHHWHAHAPELASQLTRVGDIARAQFRLAEHHPVRVEQLAATERGFPPLETRITFWTGNDSQHQYRVFKPVRDVTAADLPPWWMRDALILDEFPFCDCCG